MSDFEKRREHLKNLSDNELKARFWELSDSIMEPIVEFAKTHTSPSIERSVLLRMGFTSLMAEAVVKKVVEAGLLSKGAGGVVLKVSKHFSIDIEEAGKKIVEENIDLKSFYQEEKNA
ncbi:MAG: D-ornithine 4,5-aminomutase subunit OraS [Candidatus Muiribacteriota bacterium]|jgi:D-ornithine 4,5-aminomutase subunit alpha